MTGRWRRGETIVWRDVLNGRPWFVAPVIVVEDRPDLLAVYVPEGTPLAFPPVEGREHGWSRRGKTHWEGHGVLQLHRPGDWYAVWVFWHRPKRELGAWYVNFQEPFRRTPIGFDTRDLALDIVVQPDGSWRWKDQEHFEEQVGSGFISAEQATAVEAEAEMVAAMLDRREWWWDESWAEWAPDLSWPVPELPEGWDHA